MQYRRLRSLPLHYTFMILSAVVFTAPTIFVGNFVKHIFVDLSWVLLLANLVTYGVILLLAHFVFRQGFNYLIKYGENHILLRFSLVLFLYYIYMYAAMNLDFSLLESARGLVVRILPTVYVFVFYFLLLRNYKELNEKRELEVSQAALNQQLDAAKEQIAFLNDAQTQTAIYQHNLRHHLTAIDGFLSAGKAKRLGIRLTVNAKLPQKLSISDTELCSVLSNSLENALNAVSSLDESLKWVELYCSVKMNKLLIEVRNPYAGEIVMQDSLPVSNQAGHGYGCRSIQTITERYHGLCSFEPENGVFTLRVVLPM